MVTNVMVTEEQEREKEERVTVDEALAIVEIPGERRLEVEPEKDVAKEATETRSEGAGEAPEQAGPGKEEQPQQRKREEGGTRRRRYHEIVVELSDEEEDEDERTQIPLTKRPRTYRQTHPRVVTLMREVLPQVESPQSPTREQRWGRSMNTDEARQEIKREKM